MASLNLWFQNLKIARKLSVCIIGVVLLFLLSSLFTIFQLVKIGNELTEIADYDIVLTEKFTEATIHQLHQAINFEKALRDAEILEESEQARKDYINAVDKFHKLSKQFDEEMLWIEAFINRELGNLSTDAAIKKSNEVLAAVSQIKKHHHEYATSVDRILALVDKRDMDKVHKQTFAVEALQDELDHELEEVLLDIETFTEKSMNIAASHEFTALIGSILGLIIPAVIAFIGVRIISSRIASNMNRAIVAANKMANGDYSVDLENDYEDESGEVLDALNEMRTKVEESQAIVTQTLMQSINAVVSIDEDNNITLFNPAAEALWGYRADEVLGNNVKMLVPMDIRPRHDQLVNQNRETGVDKIVGTSREIQVFNKHGEELWAKLSLSKVQVSGKVLYTAFLSDITEEVKSREYVKTLSLVANETDNSVIITDAKGLIQYANPGFTRLSGYSLEESIGKKPGDLLQGEHTSPETVARIRSKLDAQEPFYDEILNYDAQGNPYWISLAINPVFGEDGKLERFISIQANVTETKQTSMEYSYKLDAIDRSNTVLEVDLDGAILAVNDNLLEALGYSESSQLIGQKIQQFIASDAEQKSIHDTVWSKCRQGDFYAGDFCLKGKHGDVWISGSYNPILNYDGRVKRIVQYGINTTARKQAINAISCSLEKLSLGDLTSRVEGKFDAEFSSLQDAYNTSVERLQNTVINIYQVADEVNQAANDVSQAAQETSGRVENTAATLEETAAAIEQLTESSRNNTEYAVKASGQATVSADAAINGIDVVNSTVSSMQNIQQASKRITDIIGVMNEISFQTNLLALNASVEAARAGEQGKGFSVVASEVRNLAQRSAQSAKEISGLINDSGKKVDEGTELVDQSGTAFGEINQLINEVSTMINSIAAASQEQLSGIQQINQSISNLDTITQENSKVVEKTASASSGMTSQIEKLKSDLGFFKVS